MNNFSLQKVWLPNIPYQKAGLYIGQYNHQCSMH